MSDTGRHLATTDDVTRRRTDDAAMTPRRPLDATSFTSPPRSDHSSFNTTRFDVGLSSARKSTSNAPASSGTSDVSSSTDVITALPADTSHKTVRPLIEPSYTTADSLVSRLAATTKFILPANNASMRQTAGSPTTEPPTTRGPPTRSSSSTASSSNETRSHRTSRSAQLTSTSGVLQPRPSASSSSGIPTASTPTHPV